MKSSGLWKEVMQQPGFRAKLHDPSVASWVLERLKMANTMGESQFGEEVVKWFDPDVLRTLLQASHCGMLHGSLFNKLPWGQFAGVKDLLLEQVQDGSGPVQGAAMPILAALDPEACLRILRRQKMDDFHTAAGFIKALKQLDANYQRELLPDFLEMLLRRESDGQYRHVLGDALALAHSLELPGLQGMLSRRMEGLTEGDLPWMNALYQALTSEPSFFIYAQDCRRYELMPLPSEFAWLFRRSAPLGDIERQLREASRQWKDLHQQLRGYLERWPNAWMEFYLQVAEQLSQRATADARMIFGDFLLALQMAAWRLEFVSFDNLMLNELFNRLCIDLQELPCAAELAQHLKEFPPDAMREVALRTLDDNLDTYGVVHLVRVLGVLEDSAFVVPLLECLEDDEDLDGELYEAAEAALVRIGAPAADHIIAVWDSLDETQKIYGMGVLCATNSSQVIDFLVERLEEFSGGEDLGAMESWCLAAQAHPDQRLLSCLESLLSIEHPAVSEAFCLLCVLLDHDHPKLEYMREQMESNQAEASAFLDKMLLGMDDITALVSETISLELQCKDCGACKRYDVAHIYTSPGQEDPTPYIGGDLYCKACGKLTDFEVSARGNLALVAEMMKMNLCQREGKTYDGPLQVATFVLHGGRPVSPRQGLQYYREKIEKNPKDLASWLSLGNLFDNFHQPKRALSYFQQCIKLNPACPEAAIHVAIHLDEKEDLPREAWALLTSCLAHYKEWKFYRLINASEREFAEDYLFRYDLLCDRLSLPNQFAALSANRFSSHRHSLKVKPSGLPAQSTPVEEQKVGPNKPCPCGSGRKYKKCCM